MKWYVICASVWVDVTPDKILGPFDSIDEARAVMPFALATHPRETTTPNHAWPIFTESDIRYNGTAMWCLKDNGVEL